jgi:tRNA-Thr(GGU) m(6)t(6)A37 methyltransferase TsaA
VQYLFEPIGVVRSPLVERAQAPRQPGVEEGALLADGRIELYPGRGFEDAVSGLDAWEHAWVLFVFHRNVEQGRGWKPRVQPPRAEAKVGVFATRSPHRPNPIGMSAVRIDRVEGLVVHVRSIDLLDGTPVLDLKPYVPYADARPDARSGWLQPADPRPGWQVTFTDAATEQLAWLRERGVDLRPGVESALALGPQPHAYRRIRSHAGGMRLALKEWRVDFVVEDRRLVVRAIATGYRAKELATGPGLETHREFAARFAAGAPY